MLMLANFLSLIALMKKFQRLVNKEKKYPAKGKKKIILNMRNYTNLYNLQHLKIFKICIYKLNFNAKDIVSNCKSYKIILEAQQTLYNKINFYTNIKGFKNSAF